VNIEEKIRKTQTNEWQKGSSYDFFVFISSWKKFSILFTYPPKPIIASKNWSTFNLFHC